MTAIDVPSSPGLLSPSSTAQRATLGSLTGLRWIAALVVFLYHLRNTQYFDGATQNVLTIFFGAGSTAVSLFFMLSGFVLAHSYRPQRVGRFYRRRLARILPLHLVGVALALVVGALFYTPIRTADPVAFVANVLLVNPWRTDWWQAGNPVAWSLACEAFFYACFPLLIRLIAGRGRLIAAGILVLSLAATWFVPAAITMLAPAVSSYSFPPARVPEFVAGIAAAVLVRDHRWRIGVFTLPVLAVLGGYEASSLLGDTSFGAASATSVGFILLIVALASADLDARPTWLASRPLQALGTASFAFYIVHLLVLQCVGSVLPADRATLAPFIGALVALGLALALAFALHRGVELPGHALLGGTSQTRSTPHRLRTGVDPRRPERT